MSRAGRPRSGAGGADLHVAHVQLHRPIWRRRCCSWPSRSRRPVRRTGTPPGTAPTLPHAGMTASARHQVSPGWCSTTCASRFGDRVVLDGIDLAVDEHEVVCLIGPSGCGKSTLLRCIDLLERDRRRAGPARRGRDQRAGRERQRGPAAHRHRLPVVQPVPPPVGARQRHPRRPRGPTACRKAEAEARGMELLDQLGLADKAPGLPRTAVGRSAAAGRHRPGAGERAPRSCCSTRSPRRSTPSWWARCWRRSGAWPTRA